jgi:microcystin-dependent protein
MPLESATYIDDLNTSNPAHTDGLSEADSHMRLIKSVLKTTFPNIAGAVTASHTELNTALAQSLGTSEHRFPLGTVSLPGLTPVGDPNTGIYSPGADQLNVAIAGAVVAALAAAGLTVTGTISPTGAYLGGTGQLVPTGVILDFAGTSAPTGYLLAYGQDVSRETYADLFSVIGETFGAGNGVTTFTLPDHRGRVSAGKDDMGGSSANRITSALNGDTLGATGGSETHTLTGAESGQKAISSASVTISDPGHTHATGANSINVAAGGDTYRNSGTSGTATSSNTTGITATFTLAASDAGSAHNNTQPTIILNKIIKI